MHASGAENGGKKRKSQQIIRKLKDLCGLHGARIATEIRTTVGAPHAR